MAHFYSNKVFSFLQIQLSSLFVGNTHEDVDAGFGRIAEKLRRNDAETVPQLKNLLPINEDVKDMLDIKTWMLPELDEPKQHSCQHHFKFSRVDDKPSVSYKLLQPHAWIEMEPLFENVPKVKPKVLSPDYSKINIEKLEKQIKAMNYMFKDDSTISWWTDFLKCSEKVTEDQHSQSL